jgi:hypothetical protein
MMTKYYSTASLEAAAGFLAEDLFDSADSQRMRAEGALKDGDPEMARLHESAAARLEELADEVDEIPDPLLLEYERALELEREQGGPDRIHCSMTLEVGFAVHPRDIVDLVSVYIRAVERVRADPRFANGGSYMEDFWEEFKNAGNA